MLLVLRELHLTTATSKLSAIHRMLLEHILRGFESFNEAPISTMPLSMHAHNTLVKTLSAYTLTHVKDHSAVHIKPNNDRDIFIVRS